MKTCFAVVAAFLLTTPATAQSRRPAPSSSIRAITDIINRCEDRTDDFRKSIRRALNNSPLDNTTRESAMRRRADQLERALDRTGDSWNRDKSIEKTRRYVSEALDAGRDIHVTMRNWRLDSRAENDWAIARAQLNALARAFRLAEIR